MFSPSLYLHARKKSAVDVGLVALARRHPKRLDRKQLVETIKRNGFTLKNAQTAATRIAKLVDDDGKGQLKLLGPGLKRAEEIIGEALKESER
jgi:hypothetical protein